MALQFLSTAPASPPGPERYVGPWPMPESMQRDTIAHLIGEQWWTSDVMAMLFDPVREDIEARRNARGEDLDLKAKRAKQRKAAGSPVAS